MDGRLSPRVTAIVALAAALFAGPTAAQTLSTSAAQFNAGYGRFAGQENFGTSYAAGAGQLGVDTTMTWTQGATTLVLTGAGASAGGFAATAVGGNLSVVTQQGSTTTVVTLGSGASAQAQASSQIELNGSINLDWPH